LAKIVAELDEIYADGREVSYQALREIPLLECALKETLRLHPPLVILMRKVLHDFHYKGWTIPAGHLAAASPAISNRMPEHFPNPERYEPERYGPGREEDRKSFAWLPFGAGRHRCVGAAFAMMQLKAIFSILLRRCDFELASPNESYGNDVSKMVVAVRQPCGIRYRQRAAAHAPQQRTRADAELAESAGAGLRVVADLDLCQGHGVCAGEAPAVFALDRQAMKVRVLDENPGDSQRAAVESAVRHCPTHALRVAGARRPASPQETRT
jgi:sterol 14-demethylase